MNAMEAARKANWRESLSFHPAMKMSIEPEKAMVFNSRLAIEPAFFEQVTRDPKTVMESYGFGHLAEHLPDQTDKVIALTPEQRIQLRCIFADATALTAEQREEMMAMLEGNMVGSPHAQPMLAVLVLAVAVAVFVFVVSAQDAL